MIDSVSLWIQVEQILDQENHENLCNCVPWNEGGVCVTYGELKPWSLSAHRAVEVALSLIDTAEIKAQAFEEAAEICERIENDDEYGEPRGPGIKTARIVLRETASKIRENIE